MYYRLTTKDQRAAIRIETTIKYDYEEVFKDPTVLKNGLFIVYKGTKAMDLVAYCETVNFAVSEKLKTILEGNNVKGWGWYPIEIKNIEGRYFGFQIIGKGGEVTNREKDGCVPMFKPVEWDEAKWDGSDIFSLEGTAIKVCTQKVKDILEKEKITNIEFRSL